MRNRSLWVLMLVVAACLCVAGWTGRAGTSSKVSWEYQVISNYGPSSTTPSPNVQQLNNAGEQGWELVSIQSGNFPNTTSAQVRTDYYFKRVK